MVICFNTATRIFSFSPLNFIRRKHHVPLMWHQKKATINLNAPTLMQRLRINRIAPLVVCTAYKGLWSDSRSGHFTQLCAHVGNE